MEELEFVSGYVGVVVEVGGAVLADDEFSGLADGLLDFEGGYLGGDAAFEGPCA